MSKTRSKETAERATARIARKNTRTRRQLGLEVGDRVRIVDIPFDLKSPGYDLIDAAHREMRTAELFKFCLGRTFKIYGFDRYGHVELNVSNSLVVRKKFGLSTIWIEPEFLKRVSERKESDCHPERRG